MYPDVSWCISNVSYMLCYIRIEYMYLDILHVFHTYPKRVQDTFWDTHQIHQDTCILGASLVSHWIHVRIHQDTCILDSSSRYIRIHRDTKSRYMYLGRDTCGIQSETHTSNISSEVRNWDARYMRDTFEIHSGYMYLQRWSRYMRDTPLHLKYIMRYMYLKCIQRSTYLIWRRHAGYVQDTCSIHVS